jgi:hypothetical protein
MFHPWRLFLALAFIFPSPLAAQEAHVHNATEASRCFTRSPTRPPKKHSGTWPHGILGVPWRIGALP